MIAPARFDPNEPARVQGALPGRIFCGRGIDHPLQTPTFRITQNNEGPAVRFIGGARCGVCHRKFITPIVSIPARLMITERGPEAIQRHLVRWGLAWLQHEAGRPN